jgi:hypothetical protein
MMTDPCCQKLSYRNTSGSPRLNSSRGIGVTTLRPSSERLKMNINLSPDGEATTQKAWRLQ